MREAVTILLLRISRQHDQPLLNISQEFRLKAAADFLQRKDKSGHFVGRDPPVQRQPVNSAHFHPHPSQRIQRHRMTGG
jgi:hypothetical protein